LTQFVQQKNTSKNNSCILAYSHGPLKKSQIFAKYADISVEMQALWDSRGDFQVKKVLRIGFCLERPENLY